MFSPEQTVSRSEQGPLPEEILKGVKQMASEESLDPVKQLREIENYLKKNTDSWREQE
jgi:hypothetical protein